MLDGKFQLVLLSPISPQIDNPTATATATKRAEERYRAPSAARSAQALLSHLEELAPKDLAAKVENIVAIRNVK